MNLIFKRGRLLEVVGHGEFLITEAAAKELWGILLQHPLPPIMYAYPYEVFDAQVFFGYRHHEWIMAEITRVSRRVYFEPEQEFNFYSLNDFRIFGEGSGYTVVLFERKSLGIRAELRGTVEWRWFTGVGATSNAHGSAVYEWNGSRERADGPWDWTLVEQQGGYAPNEQLRTLFGGSGPYRPEPEEVLRALPAEKQR